MRLSVITLGHVHTDDLVTLTPHFDGIEQLVLDIPPRSELARHRGELNRAIDAATADWILVIREREVVDDELAVEIAKACREGNARAFRIRSVPWYEGRPLTIGATHEIRLFHRRHYLRHAEKGDWEEIAIQGTVVRLNGVLRSVTFSSAEEHRAYLEGLAMRRSSPGRILFFLRHAAGSRALDRNTLRYIWTEAAFDSGGREHSD